jgi:hypothetical protein
VKLIWERIGDEDGMSPDRTRMSKAVIDGETVYLAGIVAAGRYSG